MSRATVFVRQGDGRGSGNSHQGRDTGKYPRTVPGADRSGPSEQRSWTSGIFNSLDGENMGYLATGHTPDQLAYCNHAAGV